MGRKVQHPNGYSHAFDHKSEVARPGSYSVDLHESKIKVKLATTIRAGMHVYRFYEEKGAKHILLDLDYRDELISANVEFVNTKELKGYRISKAWAEEQHFYFHMETSIPWLKSEMKMVEGKHKVLLTFPASTKEIMLKVGMSAVDEEGALSNLNKEIPHWSFEQVQKVTRAAWENELGKIDFQSSSREKRIIFYSALYHSFLNPNTFHDVDGRYRGLDQQIHTLGAGEVQYTVFSLWDTFRAAHPLFTITQPDRVERMIGTMLRQAKQGGDLPVWELAGNETECMIGYHSASVIADAYVKGITGFDARFALSELIKTSNDQSHGKDFMQRMVI